MPKYQATLTFEVDRPLTEQELDDLTFGLQLEGAEPQTSDGEHADWSGEHVLVDVFEVKDNTGRTIGNAPVASVKVRRR